ncbi:chromatin assembly factor 1 subunit A [Rhodotorula toruloides]|uniref:Chromatin assembly factor 1 subunit A n=1 Tax=Rhodotorula toruloides TaxID=5286 RepID=A0A511KI89_RHOTO|nr:chromatin assembly factor 1 subunit A [Rhodotorula toruloides]
MAQPSTPDKQAASSSSPLSSSHSTAATTAERVMNATEGRMDVDDATTPSKASGFKAEGEVLTLDDSSDVGTDEVQETKGMKGKGKVKDAGKGTKRKSEASSSAPSAKKSKPSTSKSAKASSSTNKVEDAEKKIVVLKGNKFLVKQKAIDIQIMTSFQRERADFVEYACKLFRKDKSNTLSDYPEEYRPFIAKLVHESEKTAGALAGKIKADIKEWVLAHLTATEDSQDADELDEAALAKRIPVAPLKTLISSLAIRSNYGLSLSSLPSDYVLPRNGDGDEISEIPALLQHWVWEVEDEEMWVQEMKGKWEKRKAEREEIKSTCLSLFLALPEAEQHALLVGTSTSTSKASSSTGKSKGKGKAKAEDADGEGGDKNEDGCEKEKKPVKEKKPKKEKVLTEEEKKELEEKARIKAEKEAEKEARRKEREEKRAAKAEKEDEKARIKAEKEAEEKKKLHIAKKQKSMFTSFFVKKSASPAPVEAGPSSSPAKSSSTSDFDRVFHPFTVRDRVAVAPVNRFLHDGKKVDVRINSMPDLSKDAALAPLTTSCRYRNHWHKAYPEPPYIVRDTVQKINDASLTTQDTSELYDLLNDRSKIKVKLLKFHEDLRPGYVGTWTKTSVMVGARNPLGRETFHLNYDVDSEAEWEEEPDDPDAEDIGSDGGEEDVDGEAGENSDADSWLAEDDEIEYEDGYDADGDMVMQAAETGGPLPGEDHDDVLIMSDPQAEKERKRKEREAKKRKAEKERRKKKGLDGPILPLVKGPVWQDEVETVAEPVFKSLRIHLLNDAPFGINPFTFVSKRRVVPSAPASSAASSVSTGKENVAIGATAAAAPTDKVGIVATSSLANGTVNTLKAKRAGPKQPFPEDQVAAFLRHVHGSTKTRPVLLDEFVSMMKEQNTPIKKNTVEAKLKELDVKKVKGANIVDAALLAQYGISV